MTPEFKQALVCFTLIVRLFVSKYVSHPHLDFVITWYILTAPLTRRSTRG